MPRFPTQLPAPSPDPWWQTASLSELDDAAALIAGFIDASAAPPSVSQEAFARALALQTLCVDEGAIDAVIAHVDAVNERYRAELHPEGDGEKQEAFGKWVPRAENIAHGLLRCMALMPEAIRADKGPALMDFLRRTEDHIVADITFVFSRRTIHANLKARPRPRLK
jgi:hypothetical protein